MQNPRRPRVAAIGLDGPQLESVESLCGELRQANSLGKYLGSYSWTETDVVVSGAGDRYVFASSVNLMVIGLGSFSWSDSYGSRSLSHSGLGQRQHYARTTTSNTERELKVSDSCPEQYRELAAEMSRQLGRSVEPPIVVETSRKGQASLIETTSGRSVALHLVLPPRPATADGNSSRPIALLLPEVANLAAWFRAFLFEVHHSDRDRVPHAPPRLSQPEDWYTPQEMALADRISHIESDIARLNDERDQLHTELAAEEERADNGIRRILWADGDDLVAAAGQVLSKLGFKVRDMDADVSQGEPKREDLRLTRQDLPGWQAIVEVKGYTNGTKTTDARQIREHRDHYTAEERRTPDLTVWLANPFRTLDPSSRPAPDQNVEAAAEIVSAVHVQASDLYRQWTLVAAGRLEAETVAQSLVNAPPGLWTPPASGSGP